MNRKQKIIISVTGIFVVLLILVGLTYAYFLTRINGNTNTKSISVSTKYLELTYTDGTNIIKTEKISPSSEALGTKTFSVTNNGEDTNYVVVIENVSIKDKDGNVSTFNSNDFVYTLECTSNSGECNGVERTTFPLNDAILISNNIDDGVTQEYTLTLYYNETGLDQSLDMGKTLEAKVNIKDPNSYNPYVSNKKSLAYNIINNATLNKNETVFATTTMTKVGDEPAYSDIYYRTNEVLPGKTNIEYPYSINVTTGEVYDEPVYWTYAENFEVVTNVRTRNGVSTSTRKFNLINPKTCKYDDGNCVKEAYNSGKDIYVSNNNLYNYPTDNTPQSTTDLSNLYKIKSLKSEEYTNNGVTEIFDEVEFVEMNAVIDKAERELSLTQDDYGTSYYYRGAVEDNYIDFAGMCWRIVRIQGDGSIKLILEDKDETCATSNGNWDIDSGPYGEEKISDSLSILSYIGLDGNLSTNNTIGYKAKTFQTSINDYLDKLKSGDWCWDYTGYEEASGETFLNEEAVKNTYGQSKRLYMNAYVRLEGKNPTEPTLRCNGRKISQFNDGTDLYVGLLTADEIVYSGEKANGAYRRSYLINPYSRNTSKAWWTLSPSQFWGGVFRAYAVNRLQKLDYENMSGSTDLVIRPSIILKSGTEISSGYGTKTNPYVVE